MRAYAAEHGTGETQAIQLGMQRKSQEFRNTGAQLYR